jgi:hypothetical protein
MCARTFVTVACVLVSVVLLGGGCAMHVPVSESVLFHDGATLPTHENTRGFGFASTLAPTRAPARIVSRRAHPDRAREREDLVNGRKAGGGLFFASYDEQGRYAFAATLGVPVMGFDATLKIWDRNYITVGYSGPGQAQAFLLHRTFNSPALGAAVAIGGRYEEYAHDGDFMFDIDTERVASIGGRGFVTLREDGDREGGIKVGTYAGYAPRLQSLVVSLTLTAGRF